MKNRFGMLFSLFLLIGCSGFAEEFRLPAGARVSLNGNPDGRTWEQCGTIGLTFAAARKKFDLELRRQGWIRIKTVDYDRIQWKSLELWSRGMNRILIQYWRVEVSLTGFAWGRWKNGAQS